MFTAVINESVNGTTINNIAPLGRQTVTSKGTAQRNFVKEVEYVYDPVSSTFVVGNGAMKHSPLAASIGADTNQVVGGIFSRGPNGSIFTNEGSGHFWQNWTPEVRQQFVDFMRSKGINVIHAEGK
ncbi:polymorphic toxin type 43 domain-containing protein [Herbaspirillum rubrisubalbicans]|uniref:polymorphic toxin type 43 domain-containing protein n=1 Tax=Herbaspirillum rubrisubalbicans TaxID=80842 RepID=UPI0015C53FFC|nr:polymorphic toxin type 43 domain-containing protein [Herbaspirillum rubrisubalbicans]